MFKKIMNKTILGIAASIFLMAQGAFAFEVKEKAFQQISTLPHGRLVMERAQSPLKELLEKVMEKFT